MPADAALRLFIPITKVVEEKRLVYGVATAEKPDRAGEICDYKSSKPYFEQWSAEVEKNSGGKSLGNVRAMHSNVAAGKVTALNFNDDDKQIEVSAKIVDDDEWKKVIEGVYSGFSQGGRYVRRWKDPDDGGELVRYTAEPSEISLVDLPCLPDATFAVVKAAGVVEQRHFKAVSNVETTTTEPTEEEVDKKAKELATADGEDEPNEKHQLAARAMLLAHDGEAAPPVVTDNADKAAQGDGSDEPVQVWKCGCADHEHLTKREAQKCRRSRRLEAATKAVTDPIDTRLAEISKALGIGEGEEEYWKRDFTQEERDKGAEAGEALPDGSFLIRTRADLKNAIQALGRAKDPDKAKAHIAARAKALDATDELPADWKGSTKDEAKAAPVATLAKGDDPACIHASMTKFHAHHAAGGDGADLHKVAAGSHAEAFLAHNTDAVDKMAKSDDAWGATAKCLGMGKADASPADVKQWWTEAMANPASRAHPLRPIVMKALGKGLPTVAHLAFLFDQLADMRDCVTQEATAEDDDSPLPDMLTQNLTELSVTLKAMVEEETREAIEGTQADFGLPGSLAYCMAAGLPADHRSALVKLMKGMAGLEKAAELIGEIGKGDINSAIDAFSRSVEEWRAVDKIGARNSASDQARIQSAHDLLKDLGANCDAMANEGKAAEASNLQKVSDLLAENETLKGKLTDYGPTLDAVLARLKAIEDKPMPAKASLRAVDKSADAGNGGSQAGRNSGQEFVNSLAKMTPEQRALALTKLSLANPIKVA